MRFGGLTALFAAAIGFVFAACGDGGEDGQGTTSSSSVSSTGQGGGGGQGGAGVGGVDGDVPGRGEPVPGGAGDGSGR